jgi:hypothetical protein
MGKRQGRKDWASNYRSPSGRFHHRIGSDAIRGEVESLLAAHEEPENVLEENTHDLGTQTEGNKYSANVSGVQHLA